MSKKRSVGKSDEYWEQAGKIGYARAMYASAGVEGHVRRRLWKVALAIADTLEVPRKGHVLDLGCGDGAFTNQILAHHYRAADGLDKAEAAINRAWTTAQGNHLTFRTVDLVTLDEDALPPYDGIFLLGILHHVKDATPRIVSLLRRVTDRIIVLEPNGNNFVRKLLEFSPGYRKAGEKSFRAQEMIDIFEKAGFRTIVYKRLNLFPNFTPGLIYRLLAPFEPSVESSSFWNALCTVNMFGFVRRASEKS